MAHLTFKFMHAWSYLHNVRYPIDGSVQDCPEDAAVLHQAIGGSSNEQQTNFNLHRLPVEALFCSIIWRHLTTLRSWIVVPTGINVPTGQMMEIQLTYLPE